MCRPFSAVVRRSLAPVALVLCAAVARGQLPGVSGTLIVANKTPATATLIDVSSGRILATLPTGRGPHEVAVSSSGRVAVVSNYGITPRRTLTVIDLKAPDATRTIDLGDYRSPHGMQFLAGDSVALVTSEASGNLVEVNVLTGEIRRVIPTRFRGTHMLDVVPDGSRAYTANILSGTVSEIDLRRGEFVRSFEVPAQPEAIAISPGGSEVWVGSNATGRISVIDAATGSVTTALEGFGFPYRIRFTPDAGIALIIDLRREEVRFIERASRREIARLLFPGGGPEGVAITPDGRYAFVSLSAQSRIAVIDVARREALGFFASGDTPDGIAYTTRVAGTSPH